MRAPKTPEDLAAHNCFTYEYVTPRNVWRFQDAAGRERAVRVAGTLHSNNGDLLAEAAARGAGIVFEPAFIVGPDVRAGRLVPLLQEFTPPPVPIYAVYPSRKHLSAKVRRFVEFLVERFAAGAGLERAMRRARLLALLLSLHAGALLARGLGDRVADRPRRGRRAASRSWWSRRPGEPLPDELDVRMKVDVAEIALTLKATARRRTAGAPTRR